MAPSRTLSARPGKSRSSQSLSQRDRRRALGRAAKLVGTVCELAGAENLLNASHGQLRQAILDQDTPQLFQHLLKAFSFQGISDHAVRTYMTRHGGVTWRDVLRTTLRPLDCSKLRGYWRFHNCGYRKDARTCAEPDIFSNCPLPRHDLRNGRLNQTAYSLFFFIRDIADGNIVEWIDHSLDQASLGSNRRDRTLRMQNALIEPLRNVFGVSDKLLSMALADMLLAAPPTKPLWLETGLAMIAIDRLVHNFLSRTGIQRAIGAKHRYGTRCYEAGGCADVVARIASQIDARNFNPSYPKVFGRFVQHGIWRWCAQSELNICNGNNIDDDHRCDNKNCPLFFRCDRVALREENDSMS